MGEEPTLKEQISTIAKNDTPQGVNVPETWTGISAWMLGRFGIGVLGFFAAYVVYGDLKISNERVITAFENATRTQSEVKSALAEQARILYAIQEQLRAKQ